VPGFVLDTSAVLAYVQDEREADQVAIFVNPATVDTANPVALPFIVLMETEYRLLRKGHSAERVDRALEGILAWPVTVYESDERWRREAARVKATNQLSVADAWVVSLGLLLDAAVVHKDPEMDRVAGMRAVRL